LVSMKTELQGIIFHSTNLYRRLRCRNERYWLTMRYLAILCIILTSTVCFTTIAGQSNECGTEVPSSNCDCTSNTAGVLKYRRGILLMCDGNFWKALQFEEHPLGSDKSNPGYSCKDLLDNGQTTDGVYWIFLGDRREAFPVYCDMAGGGWTLVFKAVSGADKRAYDAFNSGDTYAEDEMDALDVTNQYPNDYKNRIVLKWGDFRPSEARVVLYKDGSSVKELKFNAQGSDKLNWFSKDKLTESPWSDINTESPNAFSIEGKTGRNFFINRNYGGCEEDAGWMGITGPACDWEKGFLNKMPNGNVIVYSKLGGYSTWSQHENVGVADVLAVYLR
ncbi:hypothetical protein ACROYT_G039342, partial [Oculina patagonica]